VRQKIVQTVGYAFEKDDIDRLKHVAEHIKAKLESQHQQNLFPAEDLAERAIKARREKKQKEESLRVNLKELREEGRTIVGIHEVYGKVYELLGFEGILTKRSVASRRALYHLTMARLARPLSKRGSVSMLEEDFGVSLGLDRAYRTMDKVDDRAVEKIQKAAYEMTSTLLKGKIRVLFYDCTTLYFESFKPDELKKNGYSKDGKFNQPQVLLALLVSESGLPIGYEVFPGDTFEGHTLAPVLESIKEKYGLDQVIFVADSGLLSKENRAYLESSGCGYVLGARLKNLPKDLQEGLLSQAKDQRPQEGQTKAKVAYGEFSFEGARLLTKYSSKRARKDAHDREKAIEKLVERLSKSKSPKSLLSNYGYKKYLKVSGSSKLEVNESKIAEDSSWDGLWGVVTNVKEMEVPEILDHYKGLWQIESCFRIQKHDLRIRPIFHWTPDRIRAHIAICFMAFVCQQYLLYRLGLEGHNLSVESVRNALIHVQLSVLKDSSQNKYYGVPSKINEQARCIYKVLSLGYDPTPFLIEK
jgi:transposase